MKTYLKGDYGTTASITDNKDGTARLVIRRYDGHKVQDTTHKSHAGALASWRRFTK